MNRVLVNGRNRITGAYGKGHLGVDLGWIGGEGDNVYAHSNGVVVKAVTGKKNDTGSRGDATYGNYVKIKHSDGYYTLYAHLASVDVKVGEKVVTGQKIGYMGETGNAYGKHLHFEVRNTEDKIVNPTPYLDKDLPPVSHRVEYRVHILGGSWLPWVSKVDDTSEGYAGLYGKAIDGIQVRGRRYQAHTLGGSWLPIVDKVDDTSNGYAGLYGRPIDGIRVYDSEYRAHTQKGSWLPWVSKVDNSSNGYAGLYGKRIDGIQIK